MFRADGAIQTGKDRRFAAIQVPEYNAVCAN